jgi:hypothetical protein
MKSTDFCSNKKKKKKKKKKKREFWNFRSNFKTHGSSYEFFKVSPLQIYNFEFYTYFTISNFSLNFNFICFNCFSNPISFVAAFILL